MDEKEPFEHTKSDFESLQILKILSTLSSICMCELTIGIKTTC